MDLIKLNRLRVRFDQRQPRSFGVFDTMRGQRYLLRGGERIMINDIAQVWVPVGNLRKIDRLSPKGLTAEFSLSESELFTVLNIPYIKSYHLKELRWV